jgi:linearmycin/streptolysin S transport system ATP-binding protein
MLKVIGLKKAYGDLQAVKGVSFEVARGETIGLLGPNGAGKTTTVSMIAGLVTPDAGQVLIDGVPVAGETNPVKRRIGLVPQDLALYEELSAQANLELFAALYGIGGARAAGVIDEALALVGLKDRATDRAGTFSGGMKRRLNLAGALLHDPDVLLLDEPTVGVDPQSRNAIFENLETLKKRGKTLVYTTHYMEEAERLCDRIVIVDHGEVIANDTLAGLYRRLPASNKLVVDLVSEFDAAGINAVRGVQSSEIAGNQLSVWLEDLSDDAPGVLAWLSERGQRYEHLATEAPSLETVFLTMTGRSLRDV